MAEKSIAAAKKKRERRYYFGAIPMRVIRRYARRIAERFHAEKIILFGSHAYGTPHGDSDVDLLVVMPARNELDQSFKIRLALPAPFPMDLIVRTPKRLAQRLKDGDWFLREIVSRGKVLYGEVNRRMGSRPRWTISSPQSSLEAASGSMITCVFTASKARKST